MIMEARDKSDEASASKLGPYKATQLWNDTISALRQGVPRGKHRRYMRTAENCFLGSGAVDWLLEYLKKQKAFGSDVTRQQTSSLLNKFYKAGVFEEIQLSRRGHNRPDFSDSNRLYRFLPVSPTKRTRTPLGERPVSSGLSNLFNQAGKEEKKKGKAEKGKLRVSGYETKFETEEEKSHDIQPEALPQCHLVGRFLSGPEIGEVWKTAALSRLKKILGTGSVEEILQNYTVDGGYVRHNCIFLNKSGIVTNIQPEDQLPDWVLSAMRCLARWPEKVEGDLPSYPGFEKDVFGVVKEYFLGLSEPLITYELYNVVINTFVPQTGADEERAVKALQVICLFLPPASRRKLHFLLKLMSKMADNPQLTLDPSQSTRSLVLGTFQRAVLRSAGEDCELDAVLVFRLVSFLVQHQQRLMDVPRDMKEAVESRLRALEKPQIVYSPRDAGVVRFSYPLSVQQYEASGVDHSYSALLQLLDSIVHHPNMADREKRRRLRQFQKTYPHIYRRRFPDAGSDPLQRELKPRMKPPMFTKPLLRLRGLRV